MEKSLWQWIFGWIAARTVQDFFTLIIAIATVFLAIFTGKLVRVTRDMRRATEDSAKATKVASEVARLALNIERPYIFAESQILHASKGMHLASMAEPFGIDHSKMDIRISFQLRNRGKGVAVIDGVRLRGRISPGLLTVILSNRIFTTNVSIESVQLPIQQEIIGPGESSPYSGTFLLPVEAWEKILSQENQIFILGVVRYKDVFGRQFYETFRFGYQPPVEGPPIPGGQDFAMASLPGFLYTSRKKRKRYKKNTDQS
ncbi:MAG: hypothetical protein HY619_05545 [Thaumarchaeota archaeon]|nr:hypothetical protein [Nitrososphaerota archaeon]